MAEEIKKLTPTGRIQRPAYNLVAEWVKTSWDNVDPMLIQRSFKCCGISNSRDGSEDKYIFDYDWMNGEKKSGGNFVYLDNDIENERDGENNEKDEINNDNDEINNDDDEGQYISDIESENTDNNNNSDNDNNDNNSNNNISDNDSNNNNDNNSDDNYYENEIDYENIWGEL
jgi:hypothetical protein